MKKQKEIIKLFKEEWVTKDIHKGHVFNYDGIVNDEYWNDENRISEVEQDLIRKIAVVNVKKSNGKTNSDGEELVKYANEDKELLLKEIEMIKPKIIICGNNVRLLNIVFDGALDMEKLYKHHYVIHNGYIIIDYYHPACHYPNFVNYYAIASLYQQALKSIK